MRIDTFNHENNNAIISVEDTDILELIDKEATDGFLTLKLRSLSKGKTYVKVDYPDSSFNNLYPFYVHSGGIITCNEFFGDCTGSIVVPIFTAIWFSYVLLLIVDSYNKSKNENLYQYKNIVYLGIIIYLIYSIANQLIEISHFRGIFQTVLSIINSFSFIAIYTLPVAFVVSLLVIISNIVLIKKEGFNIKNLLGLILGAFICFCTVLPDLLYNWLFSASWIDIHNQNSWGVYVYSFVETTIYVLVSYMECVLLATIIIGIKLARHIPEFDKDYIIILGCQIRKDGTLTNLLKGRVNRAIEFAKMQKESTGKEIVFVPSGGKGKNELLSEAEAMKNYLLKQGISEDKILLEDKSKNTYENIKNSYGIISSVKEDSKIAFSTTNYHVLRAGSIATEQGIDVEGIGSKTKSYFWVNAFIREFVATLSSEKKKHIFALFSIMIFTVLMILLTYFNYNL